MISVIIFQYIDLYTGGIERELICRLVIVIGIDENVSIIRFNLIVPAGKPANDFFRFSIKELAAEVERVVIIEHADFRAFGFGLAFGRIPLGETRSRLSKLPHGVIERAVDLWRYGNAYRSNGFLAVASDRIRQGEEDPDQYA